MDNRLLKMRHILKSDPEDILQRSKLSQSSISSGINDLSSKTRPHDKHLSFGCQGNWKWLYLRSHLGVIIKRRIPVFYAIATATMKALLVLLTHWEVKGRENVPRNGPLIVVANHLSMIDPPLLSASIPRRIFFMTKEELFSSWGGVFVRWFGAFPVRRGTPDRRAIRQAMKVLERGQTLGIFPEGKRSLNHQMGEAEFGVAMIAFRSGAPILPAGISGSENVKGPGFIWQRPSITVTIGQPFSLPRNEGKPTREQLVQATNLIMGHVAEVLPPGYRGIWESHQDISWRLD